MALPTQVEYARALGPGCSIPGFAPNKCVRTVAEGRRCWRRAVVPATSDGWGGGQLTGVFTLTHVHFCEFAVLLYHVYFQHCGE